MKKKIYFLFAFVITSSLLGQVPQGINYQAILRNAAGEIIASEEVNVKIEILQGAPDGTLVFTEIHNTETNNFGLVNLVIGSESSIDHIEWGEDIYFVKISVNETVIGTTQLLSVPYALYAKAAGHADIVGNPDADDGDAIFEIRNKDGFVVFAVYQDGVKVFVDDRDVKSARGSFAVGGFTTQKFDIPFEYLAVQPGSTKIFIDDNFTDEKSARGSFAVGGFTTQKNPYNLLEVTTESTRVFIDDRPGKSARGSFAVGGFTTQKENKTFDYLAVQPGSTKIFIDDNFADEKSARGSFAVGGFTTQKNPFDLLEVTTESTRVFIDDRPEKSARGSFAVGGFTTQKSGLTDNFFNIETGDDYIINPSQPRILWHPLKNALLAGQVLIEAPEDVGENSMAIGFEPKAAGDFSQALGYKTQALGDYSTAMGNEAISHSMNSYAFGQFAQAKNYESYAFGRGAIAEGARSFAFGSEGVDSIGTATGIAYALGDYSFALGQGSQALGHASFAIGIANVANREFSMALGYQSETNGYGATAMGWEANAAGNLSFAAGWNAMTDEHAFAAIALGPYSVASGTLSIAIGRGAEATDNSSMALGYFAKATSLQATALGSHTLASGMVSLAMGSNTEASGTASTTMGADTKASGNFALATGLGSIASGDNSTAMGFETWAKGDRTTAFGFNTIANTNDMFVIGKFNDTIPNDEFDPNNNAALIIGRGSHEASRFNAFAIFYNGNTAINHDNPTEVLDVNGNARFRNVTSGSGTFPLYIDDEGVLRHSSSDSRLKSNVTTLENALTVVTKLRGVNYYWNDKPDDKRKVGFIAQEVEAVLPEVVFTNPNDGYMGVNYPEITAVLVEAIKEQQSEIEELKKLIQENIELKARLERIEKLIAAE